MDPLTEDRSSLDVIILALSRWDNPYSSTALSIARELSRKRRVFYVDNPFTFNDLIFKHGDDQVRKRRRAWLFRKNVYTRIDDHNQNLVAVALPFVLPINFLPEGRLYSFLASINNSIVVSSIKRMIKKFNVGNYVFLNIFNPFYNLSFPRAFRPKLSIYYTMDDISQSSYVWKHGSRLEGEAMRKAAFTLATSKELKRIASKNSNRVYYLPNGVDHNVFLNEDGRVAVDQPKEFRGVDTPVILFVGNCDHRLDYDLIKCILVLHPDKTVLIVGPHSDDNRFIDDLKTFPNIHFIGRREPNEIPRYLHFADCLIIPYQCNTLTKSIYPLKLNEYLASGTPVVSTPFSEDVTEFRDVVMISESNDDFCDKISLAIETDNESKRNSRIETARRNTWKDRASELWSLVEEHIH